MKSSLSRLALLVLATACAPLMSRAQTNLAQPPGQISYQGYLTDANGVPLATNTPQNFNVLFNIYAAASGGAPLWGESQVVTVSQGFFTVLLGVGNSIPSSTTFHTNDLTYLFLTNNAQNRYIGITVGGLGTGEIVPRLRLLASPYALLASSALSVVGSSTISSTNLGPDIGLWSVSGANIYRNNGNVGIGTASPQGNLHVNGKIQARTATLTDGYAGLEPGTSAQAGYLEWFKPGGTTRMGYMGWDPLNINLQMENGANFYFSSGNVGIGTSTPGVPLNFSSALQDKIALWPANASPTTPSYGFGVQNSLLQIHTDTVGGDIAFGYGTSASMTETMRIKGTGNLKVAGTVRMGSETGTSEAPNLPGLVVRRINSTSMAAGQVVATAGGIMTLQRDGTPGGFVVKITSSNGGPVIAGTGITYAGATLNVYQVGYGGGVGTYVIFTDAQKVGHFHLSFGNAYNAFDMTEVVLTRFVDNSGNNTVNWVGTVTSTVNQ